MTEKKAIKKPVWLKYTETEVKEIIFRIVEKNPEITSEKIGLILRDNYGIPKTRVYGFKISQVLRENNNYKSPDLNNLREKAEKLKKHIIKNKGDKKTGRSLIITKAKLKKVESYLAEKNKKQ